MLVLNLLQQLEQINKQAKMTQRFLIRYANLFHMTAHETSCGFVHLFFKPY